MNGGFLAIAGGAMARRWRWREREKKLRRRLDWNGCRLGMLLFGTPNTSSARVTRECAKRLNRLTFMSKLTSKIRFYPDMIAKQKSNFHTIFLEFKT